MSICPISFELIIEAKFLEGLAREEVKPYDVPAREQEGCAQRLARVHQALQYLSKRRDNLSYTKTTRAQATASLLTGI